jgi:1-deoxy-D-xylulose-5-phosphate synthase
MQSIEIGKSETLRTGSDVALIAIGNMVAKAERAAEILAAEGISAEVVNARFVKPLDTTMIDDVAKRVGRIITIEDGQIQGGFGSAVAEHIAQHHSNSVDLLMHGIPDIYVDHGTQDELYGELKLDANGIADVAKDFLGSVIIRNVLTTD